MAMSEFDKWWNRNQPVIEDGFQTPIMIHALRVAEMAYDAGIKQKKDDAVKSLVMAKRFCGENNCALCVNAIDLALDIIAGNKEAAQGGNAP